MYNAIICKLENVRPHSNADRLLLAEASGFTVVVGLEHKDGDIGVYFPTDGKLSEEFCAQNNLIGYTDDDGNRQGGFFDSKRKVRAQKFRGEKSDGFWIPVESIAYTEAPWEMGMLFSELNGHAICEKYFTPATKNAMGQKPTRKRNIMFKEHVDTTQFRFAFIPDGSLLYFTQKYHGTSARVGLVKEETELKQSLWMKLLRRKNFKVEWVPFIGTRRTVLADGKPGYYQSEAFRRQSADRFAPGLRKGETVYYEIVGYTDSGQLIMGEHDTNKLKDKRISKMFGDKVRYTFGCAPGTWDEYVYRITMTNEDGDTVELSWPQVQRRAQELGLKVVPPLEEIDGVSYDRPFYFHESDGMAKVDLEQLLASVPDGPDPGFPMQVREGVVLRVEKPNGEVEWFKDKGWVFKLLEGIAKEDEDYVDLEEAS